MKNLLQGEAHMCHSIQVIYLLHRLCIELIYMDTSSTYYTLDHFLYKFLLILVRSQNCFLMM